MSAPFLLSKLTRPTPARTLVDRPRLFDLLDQALDPHVRLAVLSAPAGYGKTSLVSSWLQQRAGLSAAWLSLDSGDSDPARFWSYLIAAVQQPAPQFGQDALQLLQSPGQAAEETLLIFLLNDLSRLEKDLVLILDDYHLVDAAAVHQSMGFLVERLPAACHLLLLTRSDPPFPVSLLRGRGQLLEIRQDDLSFLDDEAAAFLVDGLSLPLSGEHVRVLNAKSEGWATGLQMAALSLRGQKDPAGFIQSFAGTNRYILDYLLAEVLQRQEPHVRAFFLKTSILDELSAPLCAALYNLPSGQPERPTAQGILDYLEGSNLFVVPLDDAHSLYRYHHLFAGLLRKQLFETYPDLVAPLHQEASRWLEAHGLSEAATRHALAAGDYPRAAGLIAQQAEPLWSRGEHATLLRLIHALPESFRLEDPYLLVYGAAAWLSAGQFQRAEEALDRAGLETAPARLQGKILAVRALLSAYRGDAPATLEYARQAAEKEPAGSLWIAHTAYTAGSVLMSAGQFPAALHEFERAMRLGKKLNSHFVHLMAASQLFKLHWSQGRIPAAGEVIAAAAAYLAANRLEDTPLGSEIRVDQAFLLLEAGELEEAERLIRQSLQASLPGLHYPTIANIYLILMTCQTIARDWQAAEETYQQAARLLQEHEVPYWTECSLAGAISNLWVRQNRLAQAAAYLLARGITPEGEIAYPRQAEYVALAHLLLRQGRLEPAATVIDRLVAYVEATHQWAGMAPVLYRQAELFRLQGQADRAYQALERAIELSETYGQIQALFVLEDELIPILQEIIARRGTQGAVRRLFAPPAPPPETPAPPPALASWHPTAPSTPGEDLIEPLSDRELEVLRLLATGLTNKEIAQKLHLALQTVKYHSSNIYGKLGVASRTQAIRKAQELGLL